MTLTTNQLPAGCLPPPISRILLPDKAHKNLFIPQLIGISRPPEYYHMVICKNCNRYFSYQWEWDTFTYGAFQKCPHCRTQTFISSHNFWRVFNWNRTMLIITLEMILAPMALYLFYPFRLVDQISFPFSGLLEMIPTDVMYSVIFAIFAAVWCLNLFPVIKDQYMIQKAFKDAGK